MGKIRLMAKYRLVGKWHLLFFIFCITSFVIIFTGDFSFIAQTVVQAGLNFRSNRLNTVKIVSAIMGTVLFLLVVPTIKLGCERWFLMTASGEEPRLKELFFYFSASGVRKSVGAFLFCAFHKTAALVLFLFPSVCLSGVLYFSFGEGEISLFISYAFLVSIIFLFVSGLIFYFIYTARYFAYYPVIVSNEAISPSVAFEKSVGMTCDAYRKICFFRLSFIPWLILCLMIIPAFYVWGYYKESKAMLCLHNDKLHT